MFDSYEDSEEYTAMRQAVIDIVSKSRRPLTYRDIKKKLGTDEHVWDIMQSLLFADIVEDVGGVMVSKFKFKQPVEAVKQNTKVCNVCSQEKTLVAFYQEWSGSPSATCKECKIMKSKKRRQVAKG